LEHQGHHAGDAVFVDVPLQNAIDALETVGGEGKSGFGRRLPVGGKSQDQKE
jgi:hypothetical protein